MRLDPDTIKIKSTPVEPWRLDLLMAADVIEKRGHAKKTLEDANGRVCLRGAIGVARTGSAYCIRDDRPHLTAIIHHLSLTPSNVIGDIWRNMATACVEWNNTPERTQAEVVSALRGAARMRGE